MHLVDYSIQLPNFRIMGNRGIPGGPVIKTLFFHHGGHHFSPWLGNQILQGAEKNRMMGTHFMVNYSVQQVIIDDEIINFFSYYSSILKQK